ncbi:hypothetical protein [uncultured Pseudomonas sp.]|uniref:hypothetical protein n=1 Tax=uncultured Pseudomonas sp. TaxID=114707 RepID=UPI002632B6C2|nr:hypothetical protein [uncultured Pseudomonas sp.]
MNKHSGKITWLLGTTLAVLLSNPVHADNGLIVLTREVQPRAATRQELAPDPRPLTVQAGLPRNAGSELDDSDFAHVNTGLSISNSALTRQTNSLSATNSMAQSGGNGMSGLGAAIGGESAGSATGGVSGRVNGAIQTGLRPLQKMGLGQ